MNICSPLMSTVGKVRFAFYSKEEIERLSVKQITNPVCFDNLDHPSAGGLYDPALGPHNPRTSCATCLLDMDECPGHFGHIALPLQCYHTVTFRLLVKLLSMTCVFCNHLRIPRAVMHQLSAKLRLIHCGLLVEAELIDRMGRKRSTETNESTGESTDETLEAIDRFVSECLLKKRVRSKSTLSTASLRAAEKQFLSSASPSANCPNCKAICMRFRTESDVKIFRKRLSASQLSKMTAWNSNSDSIEPIIDSMLTSDSNAMAVNKEGSKDEFMTPNNIRTIIESMWRNEAPILDLLYGSPDAKGRKVSSPSMLFVETVSVTPTRFRPIQMQAGKSFESSHNTYYTAILKATEVIVDLQRQEATALLSKSEISLELRQQNHQEFLKRTAEAWVKLQTSLNYLMDSSKAPPLAGGQIALPGVRQRLEKKEGLFRKHMMGKRVNYACRSVISPDPYIETNEIGIPPVFAKALTYPEPVTPHNVAEMRQCVINGPKRWPGATHIQNEDGQLINLASLDEQTRTSLANQLLTPSMHFGSSKSGYNQSIVNKKVFRHIRNGDFLLLNRQPTLHKPSIMAHTAKILPGEKTIRMHYANCNTYNADFDGDEMNAHFPQNEIARAEAMLIARTDQQYLVPTDGGVLRGLIQDHVDAGVDMCSRDSFFTREQYIQLVYSGLSYEDGAKQTISDGNIEQEITIGAQGRIRLYRPTIMKPQSLWTGKQIISTILLNLLPQSSDSLLSLKSKARIPAKYWGKNEKNEQEVVFMDGILMTGVLDKTQFGASSDGLVHAVYEVYGPKYAGKLLTILGRLFTTYLQIFGFSCRMDDLRLTEQGDSARRNLIDASSSIGLAAASQVTGITIPAKALHRDKCALTLGLERVLRDSEKMAQLDSAMKSRTNKITSNIISTCVPDMLLKPFPANNMQVMTVSGAKGSNVNVSQISCLLGQQELEGKRVPTMVSGKTLPSFMAFDASARAGGYITGRFLTGIKPQEYYFHCMAGREGLIDTAVKTSRSGYLQRCIIKLLEGLKVNYDHTVRDIDGSVVQFQYGEDGLDVVKQTMLNKFDFCALNFGSLLERYGSLVDDDGDEVVKYLKGVYKMERKLKKAGEPIPARDPLLSIFSPTRNLGCVSDKFIEGVDAFIQKAKQKRGMLKDDDESEDEDEEMNDVPEEQLDALNQKHMKQLEVCKAKMLDSKNTWCDDPTSESSFRHLMNMMYMKSVAEPGEAVGILAAQSIGEPSTQMTLNTFHFAGFGAKNVTLGIPRLREIIMTASKSITTPLMRLPLLKHIAQDERKQERLIHSISRLTLTQIMTGVVVSEMLTCVTGGGLHERFKMVKVRLDLWNKRDYKEEHMLSTKDVENVIELTFIPFLEKEIRRCLKNHVRASKPETYEDLIGIGLGSFGDDGDKNASGEKEGAKPEDGLVDDSKKKSKQSKAQSNIKTEQMDDAIISEAQSSRQSQAHKRSSKRTQDDASDGEDAVSDEDGDETGDALSGMNDATGAKNMARKKQFASYDGPDEDEGQDDGDNEDVEQFADAEEQEEEEQGGEEGKASRPSLISGDTDSREERIRKSSRYVVSYDFDGEDGQWCEINMRFPADVKKMLMVEIVETVCTKVVIHEVKGISRCYSLPNESENDKSVNIGTDGANLQGIWEFGDAIDLNEVSTNDIGAILKTYGVEAARAAIMREIAGVFAVYGIKVDARHLSLIADYMTFEGGFKPFNRSGMSSNPSPFAQMSFETTTNFLAAAALLGDFDPLDSPSASLVMGQPSKGGTGSFEIIQPLR